MWREKNGGHKVNEISFSGSAANTCNPKYRSALEPELVYECTCKPQN